MAISKRFRFEVFKRDSFRCGYCGKTPPQTILEVDHIDPKKNGGKDDLNNLITSCFDCNRGKGATRLTTLPNSLNENLQILEEKHRQLIAYEKILKKIRLLEDKKIKEISDIYEAYWSGWQLSDRFKDVSLRRFINHLDQTTLKQFMIIACTREFLNETTSIPYFCGMCWKKIKSHE